MASTCALSPAAITQETFPAWAGAYSHLHVDLGTGDGTYALRLARSCPDLAVLGVDTCLDNLTKAARKGLPNLRFMTCDATAPPACLHGTATSVSVNFPFGSLLRALLEGDEESWRRLFAVAKPGARIEIRVNGSAAKEMGMPPDTVRERLGRLVRAIATGGASVTIEPHHAFRGFPSEWAKRLAYGRPSPVIVATAQ